jgi:CheY-like chemotaxis protein
MNGMKATSTILIVDDETTGQETLEALLLPLNFKLAFAGDGAEALAKAAALIPDLILLDVMMPGMDGFEACRRLRAHPLLAEVPIIMITALDDRDSRIRGIEAGADDFISKPFDRCELRARVQTMMRLNRYRRLLLERAKFEWVLEHTDDGYMMVSDSDTILYANPKARLYLGLPADKQEPIVHTFLELAQKQYCCEPERAWTNWPRLAAGATGGATLSSPRYLMRPESPIAHAFWLQVDVLPIPSRPDASRLVRLRDVTAQKILQRDMWQFHAMVSHKLRTPSLGNECSGAQLVGAKYITSLTCDSSAKISGMRAPSRFISRKIIGTPRPSPSMYRKFSMNLTMRGLRWME